MFVGVVIEPIDEQRSRIFGACFALFDRHHFVTADHVIEAALERGAEQLHVSGPGLWPVPVEGTFRHATHDLAVLRAPHDADVEPFAEVGEPVVGAEVRATGLAGGAWQSVTTTVAAIERVSKTSTAASRGTLPEHLVGGSRSCRYSFPAFATADAFGRGFCGAPVRDADERVLGVVTLRRTIGKSVRGWAVRLAPSVDELVEIIEQRQEAVAA